MPDLHLYHANPKALFKQLFSVYLCIFCNKGNGVKEVHTSQELLEPSDNVLNNEILTCPACEIG